MAELTRTHPLASRTAALAGLPDGLSVQVGGIRAQGGEPDAFTATLDVRLPEVGPGLAEVLGVELPTTPNTWTGGDAGRAVWLGPDEWLVTAAGELPLEFETRVRAAVVPLGGAAVDVSAQRLALRLTGPAVRDVLARGCSLDLHPRVFGRGDAAQTTLGQAGVVLLGLSGPGEVDDVLVLVRSSFAGYLVDWLVDATRELAGS